MRDFLKQRLKEASTWRGIGGVLVAAGMIAPGAVEVLVGAGVAVVSLVEVLRKG